MLVKGVNAYDQPAEHLAYKHLEGLEDWLFKVFSVLWIFGIAVSHTLHVLWIVRQDNHYNIISALSYLILGEKSIAYACHQHHGDQERYHCFGRHLGSGSSKSDVVEN
jgi:hypothetical protein